MNPEEMQETPQQAIERYTTDFTKLAADGKLEYCLESLVNQTIDDYEIIAVDDCSTDNSLEILRQYEKNYPDKFKVIASPVNKKQGGAKNLGLEIAKGEWIGFIDSDDWIAPDFYEKLLKKAEENTKYSISLVSI